MFHRTLLTSACLHTGLFTLAGAIGLPVGPQLVHAQPASTDLPDTVRFDLDIRPLLSDRCYTCHGPDGENRQADLRLDTREGPFSLRESGPDNQILTPGEPLKSELYLRITATDEDLRMPPADSNMTLTAHEIGLIRKWIEQGASWSSHWSFLPIPKEIPPPPTNRTLWAHDDIDRFVLARLEQEGIAPVPEASREKLIRRLSYDLTGLPPTLEELAAFLADDSPEAYPRLVDRLLASPRYGERMAVDWLDLARYADTYGYQADVYRPVWPWRDWVVEAFNDNLPYDQFITWQLAGDLLPESTRQQTLATAFNRLHRQTNEGGSIEEEFRSEYGVDRTNTFGSAFLGLTLGCARCHDHKYDPITQQEYYQLFAYFNSIDESGLYSHFTDATPTPALLLTTGVQQRQIDALARQVREMETKMERIASDQLPAWEAWLAKHDSPREPDSPWVPSGGLAGHYTMEAIDNGQVANRVDPQQPGQVTDNPLLVPGKFGWGLRLSGDNNFTTPVGGQFMRHDPFTISLWLQTPDVKERAVLWHRSRAWTDAGSRGYQLLVEQGHLSASLIHFWPGNAIRIRTESSLPVGRWVQTVVTYDGSSRAAGLSIYLDGQRQACTVIRDQLTKTIGYPDGSVKQLTLGQRFRDRGFQNGLVDELQVFDRQLTNIEVGQLYDGAALTSCLARPASQWTDAQRAAMHAYYLHQHNRVYCEALETVRKLRKQHGDLVDSIPELMVMRELPQPRPTYLLKRGAYDAPGARVERGTPASLPGMPTEYPPNRLGLARWLTDPRHPLTSRVAVNHYWQLLFGRGLVATPGDFGSQGQSPSHPRLLDWLARRFLKSDWNVKGLIQQIVLSATYRQQADCAPELRAHDPENRLLARGPHVRLAAEMLRDGALAASGLLVERRGGPPVKPFQPPRLWKEKGTATYQRDQGEGSHRRSLYTYWKRTSPPPAMLTLDAAKRDVCLVRRQATSTPLQALVLLNDPQYVEAARGLAERAWAGRGNSLAFKVDTIFRTLTSRYPSSEERHLLEATFNEQRQLFQAQPESVEPFLAIGDYQPDKNIDSTELAALSVVAEMVMNYEEAVTK
jgi:hypothetical protein